jgi:hypothetical protein
MVLIPEPAEFATTLTASSESTNLWFAGDVSEIMLNRLDSTSTDDQTAAIILRDLKLIQMPECTCTLI